uniref:Uncharacterized protein n=1 Tax=Caenorhabditis japonica TaxID=281687 RepID=A0A8R1HU52_CAEJA
MTLFFLLLLFQVAPVFCNLLEDDLQPQFFDINIDREHPEKIYKEFEDFVVKYKKHYKDDVEKRMRFNHFVKAHNQIGRLNSAMKNSKYDTKFGINKFADLSAQEFKSTVSQVPPGNYSNLPLFQNVKLKRSKRQLDNMPEKFDLRSKKIGGRYIIGEVKNQGHCGCCWAFAATGVSEVAMSVHLKKTVSLSDQEVCDCGATKTPGCIGGDPTLGLQYIAEYGQLIEDEYPYVDGRSNKLGNCAASGYSKELLAHSLQFYRIDPYNSEYDIMRHLYILNVPVAVAFRIGEAFKYVTGGILEREDCDDEKERVWHSATIVGWGRSVNKKGRNVDYWILKNSWGDWGEDDSGYVRIVRGMNWCDMESHGVGGHIPE